MSLVAVVTPSYNRSELLKNVYKSLTRQTSKNFKWYIIDDGSSDDTKEVCELFIRENKIKIEYLYKQNGGKHTAINRAMEIVKEELVLILDSDDELTIDAIKTIEQDYESINLNETICGLGYLKLKKGTKENVGKYYTKDENIDTFINERYNNNVYGDKCEVFKTEILKKYPFPEFKGERFLSESVVWCDIALKYKMKFINKGIYLCEYMQGGLSDGVQKTLFKNPKGAAACYLKMTTKPFKFKYKVKYTIAFITYSFAAHISLKKQYKNVNSKLLFFLLVPISFMLYRIKKLKYKL